MAVNIAFFPLVKNQQQVIDLSDTGTALAMANAGG